MLVMFAVLLYIYLGPILLIEAFITIFKGLKEAKEEREAENKSIDKNESPETNEVESKRIDYWGLDDEWNDKWGML